MRDAERRGIFLEKRSYRRRRVVDGLRLLPLIGAWLFLLPLIWPSGEAALPMSSVLIYVFSVWFGLILLSALLIWLQRRLGQDDDATRGSEAPNGLSE